MAETKIEWTDATWNPVRGCTKVSPGCKHCYAETFAERWRGTPGHPYEQGFDLRLVPEKLTEPLKWKKPRRVFVNSMSDLFHEDVPNEYIAAVFGVMAKAPQHTFQVLTKRAARLPGWFRWVAASEHPQSYCVAQAHIATGDRVAQWPEKRAAGWPLPNVWLGVSAEDQGRADERIPYLLHTPAAVRFVSAEPLLGPLDLRRWLGRFCGCPQGAEPSPCDGWMSADGCRNEPPRLDWVIIGGESGPKARPMDLAWARSIVEQCKEAGVACFVKQMGARPWDAARGEAMLSDDKGGDPAEWPEDLCVREWPDCGHKWAREGEAP